MGKGREETTARGYSRSPSPEWFTTSQVAVLWGISQASVLKWAPREDSRKVTGKLLWRKAPMLRLRYGEPGALERYLAGVPPTESRVSEGRMQWALFVARAGKF